MKEERKSIATNDIVEKIYIENAAISKCLNSLPKGPKIFDLRRGILSLGIVFSSQWTPSYKSNKGRTTQIRIAVVQSSVLLLVLGT